MTKNLDRLIETLTDEALPAKPVGHPYKLSKQWGVAATVYLLLILLVTGLRPDIAEKWQDPWWIAELLALLAVFVSASLSAALLAWPDLHQKRALVFLPIWTLTFFALAIYFAWQADSPPAPLPPHTFECTLSIALVTFLPAAWTFYGMRQFASTHYRAAGSIALLSAVSLGALWLRLYELNDSIVHVILWHYLPMLGIGVIGVWIGRRLLKW